MAKFKVCVQQYVEMIGTIDIEADNAEAAVIQAREFLAGNTSAVEWVEGDDMQDAEVYAVLNKRGDAVWER